MRRWILLAVGLGMAFVAGCDSDDEEPPGAAAEVSSPDGASALDVLSHNELDEYSDSEQTMISTIVSPHTLGGDVRLSSITVDDPNGNGRIDGRWYPPRVLTDDCSSQVDTAPIPTASATFIPGDPDDEPSEELEQTMEALSASYAASVGVQFFDEPSQRSDYLDAYLEFMDVASEGLDCLGPLSSILTGEFDDSAAVDTDYQSFGFSGQSMLGESHGGMYLIGDQVLLTIAINEAGGIRDDIEGPEMPDGFEELIVGAEIAQLEEVGYGA